jgi:hypothetical protein
MTEISDDPWQALEGPSKRTPRSLETRDKSERPNVWKEPSILPDPDPEDGWSFKWVRAGYRTNADDTNMQKHGREGWETVDAADHPEVAMSLKSKIDGVRVPTSGIIEVGGLVLCKMPTEMVEQRAAYYHNETQERLDSAESNYMRDSNEVMRKVNDSRKRTVFGR